jgi:hypothetical protein
MSRSHFHRIVIAVAKPASRAVAIHVALGKQRSAYRYERYVPRLCYPPIVIPRVQTSEGFRSMEPEQRVAVLDGVDGGESRDDDLPWCEARQRSVEPAKEGQRRAIAISSGDTADPEQQDEKDLLVVVYSVSRRTGSKNTLISSPVTSSNSCWACRTAGRASRGTRRGGRRTARGRGLVEVVCSGGCKMIRVQKVV